MMRPERLRRRQMMRADVTYVLLALFVWVIVGRRPERWPW
jgi:hypothetical protein